MAFPPSSSSTCGLRSFLLPSNQPPSSSSQNTDKINVFWDYILACSRIWQKTTGTFQKYCWNAFLKQMNILARLFGGNLSKCCKKSLKKKNQGLIQPIKSCVEAFFDYNQDVCNWIFKESLKRLKLQRKGVYIVVHRLEFSTLQLQLVKTYLQS